MYLTIPSRRLLINEYEIDVKEKTPKQVMQEAIELIDSATISLEYEYIKPEKEEFYSWVFSNGLR